MKTLTCATPKHSFNMGNGPEELVFNGQALDLDDAVADYLLEHAPGFFTEEPAPAEAPVELPVSGELTPPASEATDAAKE